MAKVWSDEARLARWLEVELAAGGYPDSVVTGKTISGLDSAAGVPDSIVFHAGTAWRGDGLVTNGGRILNVTGCGSSLAEARDAAYERASRIWFDGMRFRRDIAITAAEPEHVG